MLPGKVTLTAGVSVAAFLCERRHRHERGDERLGGVALRDAPGAAVAVAFTVADSRPPSMSRSAV
jgi:hypothetical protein